MRRMMAGVMLAGLSLVAQAAGMVRDPASGLAVALPEGFTGAVVDPRSGDAQIDISDRGEAVCRVVFAARRGNRPDPAALYAVVDTQAWRDDLARRLPDAPVVERFAVGPAMGATLASNGPLGLTLFILETPAGRTTMFCQTSASPPPRLRWRRLAEGLLPP